jgi:hypothetical protein
MDGIEATQAIRTTYPHIRVIGLSIFEDTGQAQAMREAGAFEPAAFPVFPVYSNRWSVGAILLEGQSNPRCSKSATVSASLRLRVRFPEGITFIYTSVCRSVS